MTLEWCMPKPVRNALTKYVMQSPNRYQIAIACNMPIAKKTFNFQAAKWRNGEIQKFKTKPQNETT